MPLKHSNASTLAPPLDHNTGGKLKTEIVRNGMKQLIELEVTAVLGDERHEHSADHLGYRSGYKRGAWLPRSASST